MTSIMRSLKTVADANLRGLSGKYANQVQCSTGRNNFPTQVTVRNFTGLTMARNPKPAKPLRFIWFIGSSRKPSSWPRKFGNDISSLEEDKAVYELSLRGEQVAVYYDDRNAPVAGSSTEATSITDVWVFAADWNGVSRHYHQVVGRWKELSDDVLKSYGTANPFDVDDQPVYFVCGHGTRDERCGAKGVPILNELRNANQRAFICSHTGGHAFAGNVIALPNAEWYAKVEDVNVKELLTKRLGTVFCRGCSW